MPNQQYQKCIDACLECATICNNCAVACLEEKEVSNLTKCIRLDLECAVICRASAELMTLNSIYSSKICGLCATICDACSEECENHSLMEHCKECAEACRTCAKKAFIIYQNSTNKNRGTETPVTYQDECAILSRAAAELISLGSTWSIQISELNSSVCNTSADEFEKYMNFLMKQSRSRSTLAKDMHQKLIDQDKEKAIQPKEEGKRKRRHVSALLAASMGRSAMDHIRSHVTTDVGGTSGLINTGTVITYKEN
ncbi:MAG TPA: four-helix bundle copper-binding protein [Hanamia sp.]|nr:four-helix bundle copper-binding protein [Hanamia sp.]